MRERMERETEASASGASVMAALEFHELANLFPMMTVDDAKALGDDIKANGQHEPIIMFEKKILDVAIAIWNASGSASSLPSVRTLAMIRQRSSSRSTSSVGILTRASGPWWSEAGNT